jgi:hypothetical protein
MDSLPTELFSVISSHTDNFKVNLGLLRRLNKHFKSLITLTFKCTHNIEYFIKHGNNQGVKMCLEGRVLSRQKAVKLLAWAVRRGCGISIIASIIHHTPIAIIENSSKIIKTIIRHNRDDVFDHLGMMGSKPKVSYLDYCVDRLNYKSARWVVMGNKVPNYTFNDARVGMLISRYHITHHRSGVKPKVIADILKLIADGGFIDKHLYRFAKFVYNKDDYVELLEIFLNRYRGVAYIQRYYSRELCNKYISTHPTIILIG